VLVATFALMLPEDPAGGIVAGGSFGGDALMSGRYRLEERSQTEG